MVITYLLKPVRDIQQLRFLKIVADDLQADWHVVDESRGDGYARQTGKVNSDGVDV